MTAEDEEEVFFFEKKNQKTFGPSGRPARRRFGREGFGRQPDAYAHARPPYPDALYAWLADHCGLKPGITLFEIGPGTGLATAPLLAANVAHLHAIEPDPRLAAYLRQRNLGPALTIDERPFAETPLPPASFDLGIAATSFHWIKQPSGLRKTHQALKPGGWFAMWWTHFGVGTDDPFQAAIAPLFDSEPTKSPRRTPFDLDRPARLHDLATAGFTEVQSAAFEATSHYDPAALVDLYASLSAVIAWPEPRRQSFLARIAQIADQHFGGHVERRFTTTLYAGQRSP